MKLLPILALGASALWGQAAEPLPAAAQSLLEKARAANPARFQFALDRGAAIRPTGDGRSFYLAWRPEGGPEGAPAVATLHGSASWAFDEFFLWHSLAAEYGFGIVAPQWWFGGGDEPGAYYSPSELHAELRSALRAQGVKAGSTLLHGFSRGSANLYGVAALDRKSGDRFHAMALANAGGASADFPPNLAISAGEHGWNVFSGTYWMTYCGERDPNPERDGCPAMRRTAEWVERFGGVTALAIEAEGAGHGGFHQTEGAMRAALDAFRANLALRVGAPSPDTVWEVKRDPAFAIAGASIPNAGFVNGEVWLITGGQGGPRLYRSADGTNGTAGEPVASLGAAMAGTGFTAGEVVPREAPDGRPELYVLGLAGPGTNRSAIFRLRGDPDGRFARDPAVAVFEGGPRDGGFIGVPDVTPASEGRLRLTYVGLGGGSHNSRTAISADNGASFTAEFGNPFGDLAVPNPRASDTNVDPAVLCLKRGGCLAVAMRAAKLYVFTGVDGRTFVPSPGGVIEPESLWPGAQGLFDPTLVELPDGRIVMYATAASDPEGRNGRVVRAELAATPLPAATPEGPAPPR